ncbi:MAG: hypothetical protein AB1896_21565, partial [Thermodesulfobacteriota bacterium]
KGISVQTLVRFKGQFRTRAFKDKFLLETKITDILRSLTTISKINNEFAISDIAIIPGRFDISIIWNDGMDINTFLNYYCKITSHLDFIKYVTDFQTRFSWSLKTELDEVRAERNILNIF